MKIVHVNTEHTWRGGESQVFNLMRGLRRLGHEVEAVTLPGSALMQRCREESLPVFELRMRSDADLPAAFRLARHLGRHPCDVLHAQTARAHSIAMLARLLGARARLVVSRRLDFPIRRNLPNLWKYRSSLVDAYIAVAGVIRDILVEAGVPSGRVSVINSSIELGRFTGVGDHRAAVRQELGVPPDAPLVGNVAALAWHKGQKDLIAAMPSVIQSLPGAYLVIVGGGEEREALQRQTAGLGLTDRVVFTGTRRDVPRLLTAFDVFCMPSYLEGLCNSVLEAFAMRVPVVATRAGGLPEIVEPERTGLLTPPRDPAALSAALVRMLTDRELAARVADAGHQLVHERFGVDHMVSRTADLYRRLVS
ncbi:MAG TPA: glycosyltransferase family 4 protein [Patescibacteria group bacterium]|nr:glycosyltransferase family 4 protein [Patescibacteria group bacterium]